MTPDDVVALRLADFVYPPRHPWAGRAGVVFGFAVRHPAGVVLVDTGIGEGHAEVERLFRPRVRDVRDALREVGLRAEDVVAVVNSHLHFDHCGQNARFNGVPIFVQEAEYAAALRPGHTVPAWVEFPGASYRLLRGDAELLPGVRVIATPGHTPGHQSVVVETDDGLVVLAGQAAQSAAEYVRHISGGGSTESAAALRRIAALAARRVLFAHDASVWERDRGAS